MDEEMVLITHTGVFHADDVLSTVLLYWAFDYNIDEVIRVSDVADVLPEFDRNAMIQRLPDGRPAIVYDIGCGRFDHHQATSPRRADGRKYCSFGLLWHAYGKQMLMNRFPNRSKDDILLLHKNIDKGFVNFIDAYDNGDLCPSSQAAFSKIIARLNPTWTEMNPKASDTRFNNAVGVADELLDSICRDYLGQIDAVSVVLTAIQKAISNKRQYIILDQYVPYDKIIANNPNARDLLYVIYPSAHTKGEWCVGAVPVIPGKPGSRKPLPSILRGRDRKSLLKYNWTFVHHSGFLGSALTKQDAIKLAAYAISYDDPEEQEGGGEE